MHFEVNVGPRSATFLVMRHFSSIVILGLAVVFCGCESNKDQTSGNAERREMARRQAARESTPADESQANLMRAQQNTVNRDGNAGRDLSGY